MYLSSSEYSEDENPSSVSLRRIICDAASSMHDELRNLLTVLAPLNNEERKSVLIDYAQRSRHLILRMLVLLRWSSKFGALTSSAERASAIAIARENCFEAATDSLWATAHRCKKLPRTIPEIPQGVDLLVSGAWTNMPSSISRVVNIDYLIAKPEKTTSMKRLKSATRSVLKECLPMKDVVILQWNEGKDGLCAAVGEEGVWKTVVLWDLLEIVDLILDRTDVENAFFLVKSVEILLGTTNHAVHENTSLRRQAYFHSDQHIYLLRRLCEDRMKIAVQTIDADHRKDFRRRPRKLLMGLRNVIMNEICIPLAMQLLAKEAWNLSENGSYESVLENTDISESRGDVPLTLKYWLKSYCTAQITFSSDTAPLSSASQNGVVEQDSFIRVHHDPPLPTLRSVNLEKLDLQQMSLERTLQLAMFARLYARLCQLRDVIMKSRVAKLSEEDVFVTTNEEFLSASLTVLLRRPGNGLEFRICHRSGALRVRPFGVSILAVPQDRFEEAGLWHGDKHFDNFSMEVTAAIHAVSSVCRRVQQNAAATAMCMLDVGATRTLPPGTAWVAASASADPASQLVPPFAPLERRTPKRFLTLSDAPARDEVRGVNRIVDNVSKKQRLTYASTSDGLVFIQEATFPEGEKAINRYNGSAAAAAAWAVTREAVERRLRRDSLLRAFSAANVASPAFASAPYGQTEEPCLDVDFASRTLLRVKCEPLPVQKAELLLRGNYAWQIRLSLLPAIFDSTDTIDGEEGSPSRATSWSVGVSCVDSILTFTYPDADAPAVRSFFRDLTRARTAAALARGVPPSSLYTVIRRSPVRLIVSINPIGDNVSNSENSAPLCIMVEYVYSKGNSGGFSVTFTPSKQTFANLAPLVEETLDASGGSVGTVLAGLLERACPIAAAAEASVREKGRGLIKFVTALRVRAIFPAYQQNTSGAQGSGAEQVRHAVDVDARNGGGIAKVIDVGRATAVMTAQSFAARGGPNRRNQIVFAPVPMWDEIVDQLSRDDIAISICANSTVFLKMEHLERFLADLVQSARTVT